MRLCFLPLYKTKTKEKNKTTFAVGPAMTHPCKQGSAVNPDLSPVTLSLFSNKPIKTNVMVKNSPAQL